MDRLTREEIKQWRDWGLKGYPIEFRQVLSPKFCQLCDLALRSLSQEAVRDEVQSREAVIREIADRLANRTVPDLPGWREAISSDIAYIRSIIFE